MNRNPAWKYLLLVAVLVFGGFFAIPNIFGSDPALQVSAAKQASVGVDTLSKIESVLKANEIPVKSLHQSESEIRVHFADTDQQLKAKDLIDATLGTDYVVALNLSSAAPGFFAQLNALPMYLGLDLRGGVHFLMEVDMDAAIKKAEERYVGDFQALLRDEKVRYLNISRFAEGERSGVLLKFRNDEDRDTAESLIAKETNGLVIDEVEENGAPFLRVTFNEQSRRDTMKSALQQNITTLRNRVNELGVAEPIIQQQGDNRIIVQLPGVQDTARAKTVLGATATLEFKLVDEEHDLSAALQGRPPIGSKLYEFRDGGQILLKNRTIITGDYITDAASGIEQQTGGAAVFISLDGRGAKIFQRVTGENIGKRLAVVFIENKSITVMGDDGQPTRIKRAVKEVITAPVIRDTLGRRFQITGLDSPREARDLALLLRAGSLAAPIDIIEERTVGPSLGKDNIDKGFLSVVVGFVIVLVFMVIWYRGFGAIANLALTMNLVLIVAVLSLLQATLTLPGIAGIVLTVGMAVDANVLIFERIREELRNGNSPQASIHAGYEKAFSTILDANVTTLIAAVVLFAFGTGPIKGFAVTLAIGIVTSMFTAIFGTRAVVNLLFGNRKLAKLSI